jgi:hypothetical protein
MKDTIMADHHKPHTNPEDLKNATAMWETFVNYGKYGVYATILLLVALALAFVDFTK